MCVRDGESKADDGADRSGRPCFSNVATKGRTGGGVGCGTGPEKDNGQKRLRGKRRPPNTGARTHTRMRGLQKHAHASERQDLVDAGEEAKKKGKKNNHN